MSKKTIITCLQNILPVFHTNLRHNLNPKNHTIFTNKYASTLHDHRQQVSDLKRLKNSKFIYNYQSAIDYLKMQKTQGQDQKILDGDQQLKDKQNQVVLLIGDPHHRLHQEIKKLKIITLQEMCGLFPEKVPLSYRNKQNQKLKAQLQKRIKTKLQKQPHISHILYTSHDIKMWDQAIQLILDHQPAYNIIQFQKPLNQGVNTNGHYKLTMKDFLQASKTTYKLVFHSQLPNVVDFNQNNLHIQWIINKIKREKKKQTGTSKSNDVIIIDQDLINDKDALVRKYPKEIQIQRVDQNSSLWS